MSVTPGSSFPDPKKYGFAGRMASLFIDSKLTPIIVAASLLLGLFAILVLPREEEPQIKVPMIDVMVAMPGASAREVESRVSRPMEKLLWEIPGVEYLYSTAMPGANLTIVRFKVGEDLEKSLVKLNQKLQTNLDRIPLGVSFPLVKPRTIDDVPLLALTVHSARAGGGVEVFDAGNFPKEFFQRARHAVFHLGGAGAGHTDHDVDHRHLDLRLLLAGQHENGEQA